MITQEQLKERVDYNPDTGEFIWLTGLYPGRTAGGLDSYGYRRITINNRKYRCGRLAFLYMTGSFPVNECDHKDHDKDNDRWENLRDVTAIVNKHNQPIMSSNTSGVTGVSFCNTYNKWYAKLRSKHLGYCESKEDAVKLRLEAEQADELYIQGGPK